MIISTFYFFLVTFSLIETDFIVFFLSGLKFLLFEEDLEVFDPLLLTLSERDCFFWSGLEFLLFDEDLKVLDPLLFTLSERDGFLLGLDILFFDEDLEVFDNWAIGYKDNIFTVIFHETARADLVLENYHVKAFEADDGSNVAGYSYYDRSG